MSILPEGLSTLIQCVVVSTQQETLLGIHASSGTGGRVACIQVDIYRGTLQMYKSEKKEKAAASSKASTQAKQAPPSPRAAKSAPPRKRASPVASEPSLEPTPSPSPERDTERRPRKAFSKLPLLDRIRSHSERHFCCYEVPCDVEEFLEQDPPESCARILMKSPGGGSQPGAQMVDVKIHEGRPCSTKGVLCLETVSMASLMELGLISATNQSDLRRVLLSGALPLSHTLLYCCSLHLWAVID